MSEVVLQFSPTFGAIAKALVAAQAGMGPVRKASENPAFKKRYADLSSVTDAVGPALQAAGIVAIQGLSSEFDPNGDAIVTVETMLLHESGEYIKSTLKLRPVKNDPQAIGSAATYGRRYGLLAICGVAPEDDDGNGASRRDDRDETIATLEGDLRLANSMRLSLARAVALTSKRILAKNVPAEWQVAKALALSNGATKVWGELPESEMLAFYKAIATDFGEPAVVAAAESTPASGAADAEPPQAYEPPADLPSTLDDDEKKRREYIAWIEPRLAQLGADEDAIGTLVSQVRDETIVTAEALDGDPPILPMTYAWRTLTLEELREFWKRVPKKSREAVAV
jgi:hypothetical protein